MNLEEFKGKYQYIKHANSIFVVNSYKEKQDVTRQLEIPTFAPALGVISSLIGYRK